MSDRKGIGGRPKVYATDEERLAARRVTFKKADIKRGKRKRAPPPPEKRREYEDHARANKKARMLARPIAVLDFETNPFDNKTQQRIEPFCCVIYYGDDDHASFWSDDYINLIEQIETYLKTRKPSLIYAHNGGKFDYYFFIHKINGDIRMKGPQILKWTWLGHEFRDSYALIPAKLAAFQKDTFDYEKCRAKNRDKFREEILRYCLADCRYTLSFVKMAHALWGQKYLTIASAARSQMSKTYPKRLKNISETLDEQLRSYYKGGRVECLQGRGLFIGDYKCYDVNSMYPYVMAKNSFPVGDDASYIERDGFKNPPKNGLPCFVTLQCASNGAFPWYDYDADACDYPVHTEIRQYNVTFPEYEMAERLGLIKNVRILEVIFSVDHVSFTDFIDPLYAGRREFTRKANELGTDDPEYMYNHSMSLMYKLLMNSSYGKFAQNPAKYKDNILCRELPDEDDGWEMKSEILDPTRKGEFIYLYDRPSKHRHYYNVGTGAMVTGHARAHLLWLLSCADDPIYCDTDSLVCRGVSDAVSLDATTLGALKLEWEASEVGIVGKKTYYALLKNGETVKMAAKGQNKDELTAEQMRQLLTGAIDSIQTTAKAPTMKINGAQNWQDRTISITAPHPAEIEAAREKWRSRFS